MYMSLAEKLNKITPSAPGLPCGIAKILAGLATEERKALETVMGVRSVPGGISNRQVHEILLDEGYDIAFASIRLHRSQQCRCYIGKNSARRVAIQKTKTKSDGKQ